MKYLEPTFRQMAKWRFQPKAQRTYGGQRKQIVPLPCLPSWSPAWRPPSGHPNVTYCLEIQVTLTEELGAIPPPSHLWMAPLMEDMLQEARTGLTKAVVIGPGRLVLFYWRHSMGEGLKVDEARDAGFLLTGAGTWVGKAAYPMTTQWQFKRAKGPLLKPYLIIE